MKTYPTESSLCLAFDAVATAAGFAVYNETAGWDQLLVDASGRQIGVQAKLRGNFEVIRQALDGALHHTGPDFRMVLIAECSGAFEIVCRHCRVIVAGPLLYRMPALPETMRWSHARRHPLPAYMPDVPAGVPSPVRLTEWKVKAIRLCVKLRVTGFLARKDFLDAGVDLKRWMDHWIIPVEGRRGVYAMKPGARLPDSDHPVVAAAVRAEIEAGVTVA